MLNLLKVFFIDTSGALCSRSSGHAIDIEGPKCETHPLENLLISMPFLQGIA